MDTTPPVLIAYNESGAPGSDVLLTGLVFPADVSVTLYFTESTGYRHTLGSFQTSVEGTFQVVATVPLNTPQGPHRFIAQVGAKSASAPFNVTPGMSLSAQPINVKLGYYGSKSITLTLGQLNPNGTVVIETDLNRFVGPIPLNGATSLIKSVSIPYSAISGTHMLTATTRIAGMVVQRAALTYTVQHMPPPQMTTPPSMELSVNHGPRGTVINVTGQRLGPSGLRAGSRRLRFTRVTAPTRNACS